MIGQPTFSFTSSDINLSHSVTAKNPNDKEHGLSFTANNKQKKKYNIQTGNCVLIHQRRTSRLHCKTSTYFKFNIKKTEVKFDTHVYTPDKATSILNLFWCLVVNMEPSKHVIFL